MQNVNLMVEEPRQLMYLREKIPVSILGATGRVGQQLVSLLAFHPWFQIERLMASPASVGKPFGQLAPLPLPERILKQPLAEAKPGPKGSLVFSALESSAAAPIEALFLQAQNWVVSNASTYRMQPNVPLVIPEVNGEHLALARSQPYGEGGIVTNPNCVVTGLAIALKPLIDRFGLQSCHVATMQAVSGAGYPGVPSLDILDNVIPYIAHEEEKIESEPLKICGALAEGGITPLDFPISASCHRVAVSDGHLATVSVKLKQKAEPIELIEAWQQHRFYQPSTTLPSSPKQLIHYFNDPYSPQPKLHRDLERGMAISIGGLRPCSVLDFKFRFLTHNTVRGAAGGSLLNAELLTREGFIYW